MAQQYGYGARANPYDQRGGAQVAPQGGYAGQPYGGQPYGGRPQYNNAPAMGRDDFAGQNVEMEPLTGGVDHSPERSNPNAILNECREIDQGINAIEKTLGDLQAAQQRCLDDPDSSTNSESNKNLDAISADIMSMSRNFAGRIKAIKQQPESGSPKNAPQLGKVDRRLKKAVNDYQQADSAYRRKLQDQYARQLRIVRPDASEAEIREAVEDTSSQQIFSQALLQSDRRGQSRSALSAVQNRHAAIQKIEQQIMEVAELFQEMNALVVQQEAAVVNIEMKGEEVVDNMDKGTQEIGVAIKSARNARKWKWWCLGITILIIAIIVIVILIYKFVIQNNNTTKTTKRWILPSSVDLPAINHKRVISGQPWTQSKAVVPGLEWTGDNKLVVPGKEWTGDAEPITSPTTSGKWVKFAA